MNFDSIMQCQTCTKLKHCHTCVWKYNKRVCVKMIIQHEVKPCAVLVPKHPGVLYFCTYKLHFLLGCLVFGAFIVIEQTVRISFSDSSCHACDQLSGGNIRFVIVFSVLCFPNYPHNCTL